MYKKYINRITGFLTIVMITLFSSSLSAQYISGPTTVTFGQYADYYLVGAPNEEVTSVSWIVYYGSIQYQSAGVISVLYSSQGTNYITVDYFNGFYWDSLYLVVEVVEASVPIPTLSSVSQPTCATSTGSFTITNYNASYTYTASPSSGVSISGSTVTAPQGSYTIIATSGGSSSSPSASVTVNAPLSGSSCGLSNENYIHTITPQTGITDISTLTAAQKIESVTYFDGLGRPMQNIGIRAGGNSEDIVTPIAYDSFGRQSKDYLPYTTTSNGGLYRTGAESATLSYYDATKYDVDFPGMTTTDINPYSQKEFEASPLNRVLKQAAPGADWKMGNGHEIKLDYQANTANEVRNYGVSLSFADNTYTPTLTQSTVNNGFYNTNELYKTVTYDENTAATPTELNGSTVEFKNKQGQVVLKRTYGTVGTGTTNEKHDTYYVYDDYGNLTYVLPPKIEPSTASITTINSQLNDLGYQYKYDQRNRLVEKKLPGKQWEFIVYDKLDRVVATGPANSPFSNLTSVGWLITKYDVFSRLVLTGWEQSTIMNTDSRKAKQNAENSKTAFNETKLASGTIDDITAYYSNNIEPKIFKLLTVNYYDNYTFPSSSTPSIVIPANVEGQVALTTTQVKGLATASWVRMLTTSASLAGETTATFYDAKARPISTYTQNYLGGYTKTESKLDFTGKPEYTITCHKRTSGSTELKTKDAFTYSPQERLLTQTHQINEGTIELIASNSYDELGQLITKEVGGNTQKVNYTYNIRGWLTAINDITALQQGTDPKDLFAFKINYNTIPSGIADVKALYNGNIAETQWATNSDNGVLRTYGYKYDNLNRLKAGIYKKGTVLDMYNESLTYDKNGNIMSLIRNGNNESTATQIDNLTYSYGPSNLHNRLTKVVDSKANTTGLLEEFKDNGLSTDDFDYDANGNMIKDDNKNITDISYNHLNLPTKITFGTAGNIVYIYNATGQKVQKVFNKTGQSAVTTDYLGGYQYNNAALKFFPTAEGYVEPSGSSYKYVYQYKDHLGNVRLSYDKTLAIQEENNYYPFGLKHNGYNSVVTSTNPAQKRLYNGKELQDELGLNVYAYGWRDYDPAIGRFLKIDRFSEKYMERTPYNYAANNPVYYVDVAGDSLYVTHRKGFLGLGGKETLKYESGNLYNKDGSAYGGKVNGFLKKTVDALSSTSSTAEGSAVVTELQNSSNNFTIVKSSENSFVPDSSRKSFANIPELQALVPNLSSTGSGGTINFNPSTTSSGFNTLGNTDRPGYVGLAHEMFHGRDSNQGVLYPSTNYNTYSATDNGLNKSEWRAVYYENILRSQAGLPLRTSYGIQLTPSGPQPMTPNMLNSNNQPINVPIR